MTESEKRSADSAVRERLERFQSDAKERAKVFGRGKTGCKVEADGEEMWTLYEMRQSCIQVKYGLCLI